MQRSLSIFGLGYVGTVTAACLAHQGNWVLGTDVNAAKVEAVHSGQSPVLEPGLGELVSQNHTAGRLDATGDAGSAVANTDISFICVGTPGSPSGKLDLRHVEAVCRQVGAALRDKKEFHLVVVRSTVLPGTTESLLIPVLEEASGKKLGPELGVCVSPEFMREGRAVEDFLDPTVTLIGAAEKAHSARLRDLYGWVKGRIFETPFRQAEMAKYLFNSWHALKVVFSNEMGTMASQLGIDVEEMLEIFVADTKLNISAAYMQPGFAFGGSCLPKDVRALNYRAKELGLKLPLCESILDSNEVHLERAVDAILKTGKKKIAVLGLSFKPGTDDLRESPQVLLVKRLLDEDCAIRIWDNNVGMDKLVGSNRQYVEAMIPQIGSLLCSNIDEAIKRAEVVAIASRELERETLEGALSPHQEVIDLVNMEKARRASFGGSYRGICW
jgi:nucleotide sugar dehydrogenase